MVKEFVDINTALAILNKSFGLHLHIKDFNFIAGEAITSKMSYNDRVFNIVLTEQGFTVYDQRDIDLVFTTNKLIPVYTKPSEEFSTLNCIRLIIEMLQNIGGRSSS